MYFFTLPDAPHIRNINLSFLRMRGEHPEWFYDDFQIVAVYGSPSYCIWNGNREDEYEFLRPEEWIKDVVLPFKEFGVPYRVTFTNFLLKKEYLYDAFSNAVAKRFNEVGGLVMVSTPMMAEYMAENFPNLEIAWSTTTDFGGNIPDQIKRINELSAHSIVVPPYNFNNKFELLKEFVHRENIEFLADEKCLDDCPFRRWHEIISNKYILYEVNAVGCVVNALKSSKPRHRTHNIFRDGTLAHYGEMGFSRIKLEGRTNPPQWAYEAYKRYFVRPEHYTSVDVWYSGRKTW